MRINNIDKFVLKKKPLKKKVIERLANRIKAPSNITDEDYIKAYQRKEVINKIILDYVKNSKKNLTEEETNNQIKKILDNFKEDFIKKTLPKKLSGKYKNLYYMSGAYEFGKINSLLRSLSTKLGNTWEIIANVSDNTFSSEIEFGIKIKGIDIILIKNNKPFYVQIKTAEGTLTGSQRPRSISELSLHENKYFVAAFDTGANWTFDSPKIEKLSGENFWKLINIDYQKLLKYVKKIIKDIEDEYEKQKLNFK